MSVLVLSKIIHFTKFFERNRINIFEMDKIVCKFEFSFFY